MQDEMLAHRLGMVPLNIDPRLLEYRTRVPFAIPYAAQ